MAINWTMYLTEGLQVLVWIACVLGWWAAGIRVLRGQPILDYTRPRLAPWGLVDLLWMVLLWFLLQVIASLLWYRSHGLTLEEMAADAASSPSAAMIAWFALVNLLGLCLALWLLERNLGTTAADVGLTPMGDGLRAGRQPFLMDLVHGLLAFAMLIVPVFLLQWLLVTWWLPSEHPVIEVLGHDASLRSFGLLGFAAVIVAPVVEEYLFRVFLQGWFENVAALRRLGDPALPAPDQVWTWLWLGPARTATDTDRPLPVTAGEVDRGGPLSADPGARVRPAWWPIVGSSGLFAVAHLGHGPDPIPLFLLALGLGYLYQRTRRILPCIYVHVLINGASLAALWLK